MGSFWIIGLAFALPTRDLYTKHEDGRRVPSASVELPSTNPADMLDCLKRHRITPLACQMANLTATVEAASPPPPAQECGVGTLPNAVCFYGRGRCQYDATRGWYCRCGAAKTVARGVGRAAESFALAPHCIDD